MTNKLECLFIEDIVFFPLERTNGTPASVIRSYYADERQRIDRHIELEEKYKCIDLDSLHNADEDIDFFLNMVNN